MNGMVKDTWRLAGRLGSVALTVGLGMVTTPAVASAQGAAAGAITIVSLQLEPLVRQLIAVLLDILDRFVAR